MKLGDSTSRIKCYGFSQGTADPGPNHLEGLVSDRQELPRYLEKLIVGGWIPSPGEKLAVNVTHDNDCDHRRGDDCDCNPDVKLINHQPPTRKE